MGVALPVIAIASTVIGTAVSAYGAIETGMQNQQLANYRAQVASNNSIIANQNATYATDAGNAKAQQQEMATRQLLGQQEAAQASSGLDVNSGSAVDVRKSTAALGTISAINIRDNAAREAYGFKQQGQDYTAESQLDKYQGKNAMTAGVLNAVGSLVGGAGKLFGEVSSFNQTGAGPFGGGGGGDAPARVAIPNPPSVVR